LLVQLFFFSLNVVEIVLVYNDLFFFICDLALRLEAFGESVPRATHVDPRPASIPEHHKNHQEPDPHDCNDPHQQFLQQLFRVNGI
jgi:hypothetical protein